MADVVEADEDSATLADLELGDAGVVAAKLPAALEIHAEEVAEQGAKEGSMRNPEQAAVRIGGGPVLVGTDGASLQFGDGLASGRRDVYGISLPTCHQVGGSGTNFAPRAARPQADGDLAEVGVALNIAAVEAGDRLGGVERALEIGGDDGI